MTGIFISKILWNYTILWITHVPLPSNGYGYERESTNLQQFMDLVFQDDLIKHKQTFDVIMDDTLKHSTEDENTDDLRNLFKVLWKYGLKYHHTNANFSRKR